MKTETEEVQPSIGSPLATLKRTLDSVFKPLTNALDNLTTQVKKAREEVQKAIDHIPEKVDLPLDGSPAEVFDMETAIKASGQWECGTLVCRQCDHVQNLECLATYDILAGSEKPGKLHAEIVADPPAGLVPVARLRAPKAPDLSAPFARPKAESAPAPAKVDDVPLAEQKRPALVKAATALGMKKATTKTKDQLLAFIEAGGKPKAPAKKAEVKPKAKAAPSRSKKKK